MVCEQNASPKFSIKSLLLYIAMEKYENKNNTYTCTFCILSSSFTQIKRLLCVWCIQ